MNCSFLSILEGKPVHDFGRGEDAAAGRSAAVDARRPEDSERGHQSDGRGRQSRHTTIKKRLSPFYSIHTCKHVREG